HLGWVFKKTWELLFETALRIDHQYDDIGIAGTVPRRGKHGAVEPPLWLKDAGRIDEDDLRLADQRDAAHGPPRRLCLVGDDRDLGSDQRIGQRRLAAIRRADQRHEAPALILSPPSVAGRPVASVATGARSSHHAGPARPLRAT